MTVENDGLSLGESAVYEPGRPGDDPPSPTGTGVAGHEAGAPDQATVNVPAASVPLTTPPVPMPPVDTHADQSTEVLPPGPPAGSSASADSTTVGVMEGDLFDGTADR